MCTHNKTFYQDKQITMIEKLKSLKDKLRGGEQKDLRQREKASKERKEERGKRVTSGRKLKATKATKHENK